MMQNNEVKLTFRSSAHPDPDLPLGIRSVGLYDVSSTWSEVPRQKDFYQVFHVIRGKLRFRNGTRVSEVGEGGLFQYYPGEVHHVRVLGPRCRYFWITFDHPVVVRWLQELGFSERHQEAGSYREGLYERIASALKNCTPGGDRLAAREVFDMLLQFQGRGTSQKPGSLGGRARQTMNSNFKNPDLCVTVVASQLEVHRTTLMRAFKSEFGISPCRYLQNLRIQHALTLLKETVRTVQEIAVDSGFVDANYFARLVRQKTGLSPLEFRKN